MIDTLTIDSDLCYPFNFHHSAIKIEAAISLQSAIDFPQLANPFPPPLKMSATVSALSAVLASLVTGFGYDSVKAACESFLASASTSVPASAAVEVAVEKPKKAETVKKTRVLTPGTQAAKTAFMTDMVGKVKTIWREMVAQTGVTVPEDEEEFKAVAKAAGVTYKMAQLELAIRKIMEEEAKDHDEAKALYEERKAAPKVKKPRGKKTSSAASESSAESAAESDDEVGEYSAASGGAPTSVPTPEAKAPTPAPTEAKVEKPKPKKVVKKAETSETSETTEVKAEKPKKAPKAAAAKAAEPEVNLAAQFEKEGIICSEINGVEYYMKVETQEVFQKLKGDYNMGKRVGVFDADEDKIIPAK